MCINYERVNLLIICYFAVFRLLHVLEYVFLFR